MGYWDVIGDGVKRVTPVLSSVMHARGKIYRFTSAAFTKIDQVVGADGSETRAQIVLFTTTLAKNTARYAVYEGFKHIPGVNVVTKLVSKTMNDMSNHPAIETEQEEVDTSKEDLRKSKKSQSKNKKLGLPSPPRARL